MNIIPDIASRRAAVDRSLKCAYGSGLGRSGISIFAPKYSILDASSYGLNEDIVQIGGKWTEYERRGAEHKTI